MHLIEALGAGVIAGYAIAIPVGAIAVLIIDVALRRGFRAGFAAGSGAAGADLIYAGLATVAGAAVAPAIAPLEVPLGIASGLALVGMGQLGLWRQWRRLPASAASGTIPSADVAHGAWRTYRVFLGLTLLNPATLVYFACLTLGGTAGGPSVPGHVLFVIGAAASSWSWQSLLAAFGALAGRRLSPSAQAWASIVGHLIVVLQGAHILLRAASGP
jgi:threonine/homoserine/homoserine lactone efflux protein